MMLKLFGAALMTAGGAGAGFALVRAEIARADAVEDVRAALGILRSEISLLETPLPDIFDRLARDGPESARDFFAALSAGVYPDGFAEAWRGALPRLALATDAERVMDRLALTLGRYGAGQQCAELDAAGSALADCVQRLRERTRIRRGICPGLGASAAAVIAVLLL